MCSSFTTRTQSIKFSFHNVHFRWPLTIKEYKHDEDNICCDSDHKVYLRIHLLIQCKTSNNFGPIININEILEAFTWKLALEASVNLTSPKSMAALLLERTSIHLTIKDLLPCLGLIGFSLNSSSLCNHLPATKMFISLCTPKSIM